MKSFLVVALLLAVSLAGGGGSNVSYCSTCGAQNLIPTPTGAELAGTWNYFGFATYILLTIESQNFRKRKQRT